MTRYVVLLRGVNVGGHNKVPMATFRQLLTDLGYTDVATYLQSGNAVFSSSKRSTNALANEIEKEIDHVFGLTIPTLVLSQTRLGEVVAANPMANDDDPKHLHVAFLSAKPKKGAASKIDAAAFTPDRFVVMGDVVYLHYPNGMGRSKLDPGTVFARMGVWSTARNWRTVNALVDLAASV